MEMASLRPCASLVLLLISSLLHLQTTIIAEAASIYFLDSPTHHYLRSPSDVNSLSETDIMSPTEVSAAVSVLLGSIPSSTLSVAGSVKLNKLLMPNPFHRPHSVFALEVTGVEGSSDDRHFSGALRSQLAMGESNADILLHEEDQVSVNDLNNLLHFDNDEACSDKDLNDIAAILGGSYRVDNSPLNGKFLIKLTSGADLGLDLSKKADREFIIGLVSLIRRVQKVTEMHQDLSGSRQIYPELITGTFNGIRALQEHYGTEGVAQLGLELFVQTISKIFDSLQAAYQGKIVGVIILGGGAPTKSTSLLNVMVTSHSSARWLEEAKVVPESIAVAEALLVRRIVAWTTGLMLIIATLLGIYFLMNMPLTKDTLLYSNVKLD